jgi:vancomycin permeability regulator SanA
MLLLLTTAGPLSPPPGTTEELAGAVGRNVVLLGASWLVVGGLAGAFNARQRYWAFTLRSALGGMVAMMAALVVRGALFTGTLPLGSLLLLASDGAAWLLAWRLPAGLAYAAARRLGWRRVRAWSWAGLALASLAACALVAPRAYAVARYGPQVYPAVAVPARPMAVVFGAGIRRDGRPSSVLENRVITAAELYHAGKAQVLLLSGDGRSIYYDEPGAMRRLGLALGVPDEAMVLDYAGLSTYDSCYRAQAEFGAQDVILVTQGFQLVRALFICEALGVEAVGVAADREVSPLRSMIAWNTREVLATAASWWDVYVARPEPTRGRPVPAAE